MGPALFYSLAIITVSFLPVFVLEAQEGRLFKPLAFTKTYAMAAAAILSVTLVPVLMGYFVRGRIVPERRNPLNVLTQWIYRPFLDAAVAWPWATVLLAAALVGSMWYPAQRLGTEFMPELNEGDFLYMPSLYPGVSIGKAREVLQQTNRMIAQVPEVETVHGKLGRAETATDPAPLTMIETTIQLKPREDWRPGVTMDDIRDELDAARAGAGRHQCLDPADQEPDRHAGHGHQDAGGGQGLGRRSGCDRRDRRGGRTAVADIPGTASAYAERPVGGRFIEIDIDRMAAARYGLSIAEVQQVVQTAIGGQTISESVEGLERFPINLRYPRDWRDSPDRLADLPMVTPSGAHIPLGAVAEMRLVGRAGHDPVRERAAAPASSSSTSPGATLAAMSRRRARWWPKAVDLPPGYSLTWAGQYEYVERVQERLTMVAPATLLIITLMLFLAFNRVTEVAIILLALPVALAGGVWLIWYLGFAVSVAVLVGFIALAGVAVETAIVMLLYLNLAWDRRVLAAKDAGPRRHPRRYREAVFEGALLRLRPKLMTVATIFAGLIPIMYGDATGSEVMQRIAAPMIGGMATATLLTLFVIPAIFVIWKRLALTRINRQELQPDPPVYHPAAR